MYQHAKEGFIEQFGESPTITTFAPGRVNLIGEHTDYNDGFCLPCAIDYGLIVTGKPNGTSQFRVFADQVNMIDIFDLQQDILPNQDQAFLWTNYVRGVVKYLQEYSYFTKGADLFITGNVPLGSGLSSSAALEISIALFCVELAQINISQQDLALIGQKAENQFVGSMSGNMDQLSSVFGIEDYLLLLDCRSLEITPVALPDGYNLVVINSGIKHSNVGGEYNTRRKQCNQAAQFLGYEFLRDVSVQELESRMSDLEKFNSKVAQRAKHVVYENQRVLQAVQALQNVDIANLSRLMHESHQSMKDDFEITIPEIDYLVTIGKEILGDQGGIRMTGGGFGGCVVAVVPQNLVDIFEKEIKNKYLEFTSGKIEPEIYICSPSSGAMVINE